MTALSGQVSLLSMGTPPTIQFASLSMADSLILMVLALVVFGPRRLPQIGRQIGKLMYEFRKASNDFKFQMEEELRNAEEADRRKAEEERLRALALAAPPRTIEATAGTPVADGQFPTPSPYPGETEYPAVAAAASPEAPEEETYPRIQPPSTGEPVPAARPGSPAAQIEAPAPAEQTAEEAVSAVGAGPEGPGSNPDSSPADSTVAGRDGFQPIPLSPEVSPAESSAAILPASEACEASDAAVEESPAAETTPATEQAAPHG